jgi:hypothetical protein
MRPTSKWHFVLRFPSGSLEIPTTGLPWLWGLIILRIDLWLKRGLKQSFSPRQELSNGMSHVTCTEGNRVDSRFLVIGSQISNSTPGPSFGHNLCLRCPNGSCEPILDIYVSIAFQWYKEVFNPLGFDPCNCSLKIWESTGTSTPKVGIPLGVRVYSLTLSYTPRNMWHDSHASLLAYNFVSLCLGHEPKAKVVTPCHF